MKSKTEIQEKVILDVLRERENQDRKWGVQNHKFSFWNTILVEEVGEVAKEILDFETGGHNLEELREEMVQTAAVAISMLECLDRNYKY